MKTSYHVAADGKSITCNLCGRTSHNHYDVELRFCGACGLFHEIDEADRQLLLLGMALLSIERPGFKRACEEIAKKLVGEKIFLDFVKFNTTSLRRLAQAQGK